MSTRQVLVMVAVATAVVAALLAFGFSRDEADAEGTAPTLVGVAAVGEELAGVAQRANALGSPDAPVQIVEYGDLACPACKAAAATTIPGVIAEFVRGGDATLEFRPIAFIGPSSERGALAAEAAAEQDAMWPLIGLLYRSQGDERTDWLTDDLLEQAVTALGLDVAAWRRDYRSPAIRQRVAERAAAAEADEVRATPTFIIRGPRGLKVVEGVADVEAFRNAITEVGPS